MSGENYHDDIWGMIYDQYNNNDRHKKHLEYYLKNAVQKGGRTLECGCGTGMILLPIHEKGVEISGFDISPVMIDKLLEKGPEDLKADVSVQELTDFCYDRRFDLIIIPNRTLNHLEDESQIRLCFKNIYRHLNKDGLLIFDMFNPHIELYVDDSEYRLWNEYMLDKGVKVTHFFKRQFDFEKKIITMHNRFKYSTGEDRCTVTRSFWVIKDTLKKHLSEAGFAEIDFFSNFDEDKFSDESMDIVCRALKHSGEECLV